MTPAVTAIVLYILLATASALGIKKATKDLPKAKGIALQFAINLLVMVIVALVTGENFHQIPLQLAVVAVGFTNSIGAYFQWKAYEISLSKSSIFMPIGPVWASILAAIFLKESSYYFNSWLLSGAILLHAAAFLFEYKGKSIANTEEGNRKWLLWILIAVFIFGSASFLMKVFTNSVGLIMFLLLWYLGSLLGSLILAAILPDDRKLLQPSIKWIPLVSFSILGARLFQYRSLQLVPGALFFPFQSIGTSVLATIGGLIIFKESKGLRPTQWIAFATGLVGIIFLVTSQIK